ncbi:MAG: protein-tyrosine phosphatase family protein [Actinomycetota bacterium]|nr:protein-tyrosine phosphatase family protein [Actinomycetota bacterium]
MAEPGVLELPDGARLRGRGIRQGQPTTLPDWTLYLLNRPPQDPSASRWVRWPDFWVPHDLDDARSAFQEAHRRALAGELVDVSCAGGRGRTGTAIACIAQLGGVPAAEAVAWTRRHYSPHAIEMPWQRRYAERFSRNGSMVGIEWL